MCIEDRQKASVLKLDRAWISEIPVIERACVDAVTDIPGLAVIGTEHRADSVGIIATAVDRDQCSGRMAKKMRRCAADSSEQLTRLAPALRRPLISTGR